MSRNKDVPTGTKLGDLKRIGGFDLGIYYIDSETHKWEENLDTFERALNAMQDTFNRMKAEQAKKEILRKAELMQVEVYVEEGATYEKKYLADLTENQLLEYREMIDAVLMEEYNLEVEKEVEYVPTLPDWIPDWSKLDDEDMSYEDAKAIVHDALLIKECDGMLDIDYKAICRLIKEAV